MNKSFSHINKNASFLEDALRTIKDKAQLIDKPFETIFSIIGPMLPKSNLLKAILMIAEVLGYGPGRIGEFIDNILGLGTKEALNNLSSGNLEMASTTVVDTLLEKIGIKAESMMKDIYIVKGTIDVHDLISIATYVKYNPTKVAASPGRIRSLRRFLGGVRGGGRLSLINALYAFLRTAIKGLIGLGIAGGTVGKVKEIIQPGSPTDKTDWFSPKHRGTESIQFGRGPTDIYLNNQNDVEGTLIHFLNSQYKVRSKDNTKYISFSEMFETLNGYPLRGSEEMRDILKMVNGLNWGELEQIGDKRTFVGPKLELIAKKLLPVMQLESEIPDENKELLQALQGVYK